jgi:hypothetical protein
MFHARSILVICISAVVLTACAADSTTRVPIKCDPENLKPHKLKFKTDNKDCVIKVKLVHPDADNENDASIIQVCRGETVTWKATNKKKTIAFDKGTGTPLDWTRKDSDSAGIIMGTVPKDAPVGYYEYSVYTDGACQLDPMIIVRG